MRKLLAVSSVALAVLALALVAFHAYGADDKSEERTKQFRRKPLIGLKDGFRVAVDMATDYPEHGLTRATIQTAVELRLRRAGVPVLTEEQALKTDNMPTLAVSVMIMKIPEIPVYASVTDTHLEETVSLLRAKPTLYPAITTHRPATLELHGLLVLSKLKEQIGEQVDEFLNDYLAANPKDTK